MTAAHSPERMSRRIDWSPSPSFPISETSIPSERVSAAVPLVATSS